MVSFNLFPKLIYDLKKTLLNKVIFYSFVKRDENVEEWE